MSTESMTVTQLIEFVEPRGACHDALAWLGSLPPEMAAEEAYQRCNVAEWVLWLAKRAGLKAALGNFSIRRAIQARLGHDALDYLPSKRIADMFRGHVPWSAIAPHLVTRGGQ